MAALTFDDLESGSQTKQSSGAITFDDIVSAGPTQRQRDITTSNARVMRGMRDPVDAGAQMLTNVLPAGVVSAGNKLNNWLADKTGLVGRLPDGGVNQQIKQQEQEYQDARKAVGQSGQDWARMGGNMITTLPVGMAAPATAGLAARVGYGAATGAAGGALQPVTNGGDDFWSDKGKQVATGAAVGGAIAPVAGAVGRMVSPKASTNPQLAMLRDAGVNPTVGQALGGRMNALEEKLTSIPIMGDMISRARGKSIEGFNNAAINRATTPIGVRVNGSGQQAVREAGDALSSAYDEVLGSIKGVSLDNQFANDLDQLKQLATGLVPDMRRKFDKLLQEKVMSRKSPVGGFAPETYKTIDSELGTEAAKWSKSPMASESEYGGAVEQLNNILNQNMRRSNPDVAARLADIDSGWANLVRIEGAAKAGKNAEGIFTPGQLNQAISTADQSTRKRAVSRGTALMQDLGNAGQSVIGNKVPNSFTTDRALLSLSGLGAGAINPAIPGALLAGGALYTQPAQKALVKLIADRPELAPLLAQGIRRASPMLGMPLVPSAYGLLGPNP
jgi:hypothetical protein